MVRVSQHPCLSISGSAACLRRTAPHSALTPHPHTVVLQPQTEADKKEDARKDKFLVEAAEMPEGQADTPVADFFKTVTADKIIKQKFRCVFDDSAAASSKSSGGGSSSAATAQSTPSARSTSRAAEGGDALAAKYEQVCGRLATITGERDRLQDTVKDLEAKLAGRPAGAGKTAGSKQTTASSGMDLRIVVVVALVAFVVGFVVSA